MKDSVEFNSYVSLCERYFADYAAVFGFEYGFDFFDIRGDNIDQHDGRRVCSFNSDGNWCRLIQRHELKWTSIRLVASRLRLRSNRSSICFEEVDYGTSGDKGGSNSSTGGGSCRGDFRSSSSSWSCINFTFFIIVGFETLIM